MSLIDTACVGRVDALQLAALGPNTALFSFAFQVGRGRLAGPLLAEAGPEAGARASGLPLGTAPFAFRWQRLLGQTCTQGPRMAGLTATDGHGCGAARGWAGAVWSGRRRWRAAPPTHPPTPCPSPPPQLLAFLGVGTTNVVASNSLRAPGLDAATL